ncbi:MAG: sigma-70 family RNA polymerase sigma factor [Planctomycetes bacterium]|nr:sigma-70 family RNA polymerase sigma factor [Planctomycetota bacterium]
MSEPVALPRVATVAEPEVDEPQLVARLQSGESDAFELMVRLYGGRMLMVARRLLFNEEDAREAVQEAMLSAFRGIGGFAGQSKLSTWLHRIAVNASLLKLRSQRRVQERPIEGLLPRFLDDGHQERPAVEWRETATDIVQSRESRELVRRRIAELPETYRTVLMLRDIEELDTRETAELLGIEENAVKVRLHRARQALRTLLDEHFRGNAE